MEFKEYNEGELEVSAEESENRYETSAHDSDERFSSIAIIAAILLLSIITSVFFGLFTRESIPVLNTGSSTTTTTTTTTQGKPNTPDNPDSKYPFATVTDKTQFIATMGGNDLSDIYLYSEYAILIKLSDMTTIAHQDADTVIYPASMTKVMTVIVALDMIEDLNDGYTVTQEILDQVPEGAKKASLSLFVGETVTVRDLLYGVAYISGADSVLCLVDYFNLTVEQFAALMNEKAAEIGLQNTTFGGAIGMDAEENQTTCRDMAAIMAYAMENPLCREIFGEETYKFDYHNFSYKNSTFNGVVWEKFGKDSTTIVPGYTLLATKSGLEDKAGYCLVSLLKNNTTGEEFVLVTAKSAYKTPYNQAPILDMVELFNKLAP